MLLEQNEGTECRRVVAQGAAQQCGHTLSMAEIEDKYFHEVEQVGICCHAHQWVGM
jgi:hypothetical protein